MSGTIAGIMETLRTHPPKDIAGCPVTQVVDYEQTQQTGLPASNVLMFRLEGGASVIVRPSGTEPKIKMYFTTLGKDLAEAEAQKEKLAQAIETILK